LEYLRQQLFEHSQWITNRLSKTLSQVEAHYRSVMGLVEEAPRGYS
jgi:hypothetical protein